jgi:hypothetical protein
MLCDRPIPEAFRRGPDRRSDSIRKRVRIRIREKLTKTERKPCPKCWRDGQRGWAKGFCKIHAKEKGLEDHRRNHKKAKEEEKKAKKKKPTTNEKKLTQAEVEANNLDAEKLKKATRTLTFKLLKPYISDQLHAESDAEFAWCEDLQQDSVNSLGLEETFTEEVLQRSLCSPSMMWLVGGLGWSRGPGARPESAWSPKLGVNQGDGYGRREGQGPGWTRLGPWLLRSRPIFSFEAS